MHAVEACDFAPRGPETYDRHAERLATGRQRLGDETDAEDAERETHRDRFAIESHHQVHP